jgi:ZIP family zinc transporter
MGNDISAVVWATLASVAGTGLGGLAGCFGGRVRGVLPAVLGFASGLMTAIVCFELLPEAAEAYGIAVALIGMAAGIAAVWLASSLLPGEEGGLERTSFLVLAAIALHNLPEGLAIGSGWAVVPALGAKLALVIGLHDFPEGMAISAPMAAAQQGKPPLKQALLATLTGIPTGLGAVLGVWLGRLSPMWMALCLGFSAGAMLYVTTGEMLPRLHEAHGGGGPKIFWQLAGFAVGMIVSWI